MNSANDNMLFPGSTETNLYLKNNIVWKNNGTDGMIYILFAELAIVALLYIALYMFLQRRIGNPIRSKEIQALIKMKQVELRELQKQNVDRQVLMMKQKEIMPLFSESMKIQFKPMLIILPVFLAIFYLVLPQIFPPNLTFSIFSISLSYQWTFILLTFAGVTIANVAFSVRDNKRLRAQTAAKNEIQV
jgi:membrane protein insertase Oxa1/YidC/SpoIIIJ